MHKFYNYDLDFVCEPEHFNIMRGPSSVNLKKHVCNLYHGINNAS